jgi:hypothetical protein
LNVAGGRNSTRGNAERTAASRVMPENTPKPIQPRRPKKSRLDQRPLIAAFSRSRFALSRRCSSCRRSCRAAISSAVCSFFAMLVC